MSLALAFISDLLLRNAFHAALWAFYFSTLIDLNFHKKAVELTYPANQ